MSQLARLLIQRDGEPDREALLENELQIGRGEDADLRLDDQAVSRNHAVMRLLQQGIQIEKKSSFAPLSVDGSEITSAILKNGQVIELGPYRIKVALEEAAAAQVETPLEVLTLSEVPPAVDIEPAESILPSESIESVDPPPTMEVVENTPELEIQESPSEFLEEDSVVSTKVIESNKVKVVLSFPPGTANVTEYDFESDEIVIGRSKECDIVLKDKKASKQNTRLKRKGIKVLLEDLGSSNGTYVNGVRVQEKELSGGDLIRIGDTEFDFNAKSADYEKREKDFLDLPAELPPVVEENDNVLQLDPIAAPMYQSAGVAPAQPQPQPVPQGSPSPQSLADKYKSLPQRKRIIYILALGTIIYMFIDDYFPDATSQKVQKKESVAKPVADGKAGPNQLKRYESLSPDQKAYVESQYQLALGLFTRKEYEKSLFEVSKVFELVDEYKDARDIERYALEGKRRLEAQAEEKRRREEEEQRQIRIREVTAEIAKLMNAKKYDQAESRFSEILVLDPEDKNVDLWRQEIDEYREKQRAAELERQRIAEINKNAQDIFDDATRLRTEGKIIEAINRYNEVLPIQGVKAELIEKVKATLAEIDKELSEKIEPLLKDAKTKEAAGELAPAFKLYEQASATDPRDSRSKEGMNRIRDVLHERAKVIYTEAVIAESYSDFELAKKKFIECMDVAPKDDIYFQRSDRKLKKYAGFKNEFQPGNFTGGAGGLEEGVPVIDNLKSVSPESESDPAGGDYGSE